MYKQPNVRNAMEIVRPPTIRSFLRPIWSIKRGAGIVKHRFTIPDNADATKLDSAEGNPACVKMMGEK